MKPKNFSYPGLLLIVTFIILITACNQATPTGKIPYNEDSVRRHILPIRSAVVYTMKFRNARDTFYRQLPPLEKGMNLGQAESFNRDAIAVLLNQNDSTGKEAAGIRVYYGLDEGGQVRLVLVPYDQNGNDIINKLITEKTVNIPGISSAKAFADDGQTIENGQRCPTACSNGSSGLGGQ